MASKIDVTTIKNISEYPNAFKRQGNFPLDLYSLFNTKGSTTSTDLDTAEGYAQKSGVAYTGQIVTVSDQSSSNPQPRAYLVRNTAKNNSYLDELALMHEVRAAISAAEDDATPYLSRVQWGGVNKVGAVPAIASAFDPSLFANRLAYTRADCIKIENSTDGGTTWTDQTVDTSTAFELTTGGNGATNIKIGGPSVSGNATVDYKTRITLSAKSYLYFTARFFNIYVSTGGATGSNCKIETSTDGTTYTNFGTFDVGGWGGWNYIPFQKTFGGSAANYIKHVRFTFGITGVDTQYASRLSILKIRAFGETCWNGPSDLAKFGEMYRPLSSGAAYFPKGVISSDLRIGNDSNSYSLTSRITKRIPIIGIQRNSYYRSVIALCKVSAANSSGGSFAAGRLIFHRNNGLSGTVIATVTCEDAYGPDYGANISITGAMPNNTSIVGCTFTYNGKKWAGVEVYISPAELKDVYFEGEVSDVANVFGVDYYNVNTSTALNTEINSSIVKAPNSIINYVYNNFYHNGQEVAYVSDLADYAKKSDVPVVSRSLATNSTEVVTSDGICKAFKYYFEFYGVPDTTGSYTVQHVMPRLGDYTNNMIKTVTFPDPDGINGLSGGIYTPKVLFSTPTLSADELSTIAKRYRIYYAPLTGTDYESGNLIGDIDIPAADFQISLDSESAVNSIAIHDAFANYFTFMTSSSDETLVTEIRPKISGLSSNIAELYGTSSTNNDGIYVPEIKYKATPGGSGDTYAKRYTLYYSAEVYGDESENKIVDIDIPKDMVVASGEVKNLASKPADFPTDQTFKTGMYIILTLANSSSSKIYIPADGLVEYVTAGTAGEGDGIQVAVSDDYKVTATLLDNAVTTDKIKDSAVTATELASSSVTTVKIKDLAVIESKIANSAVTAIKIKDGAVGTTKIADQAVTNAKIQNKTITKDKLSDDLWTSISNIGTKHGVIDLGGFYGGEGAVVGSTGAAIGKNSTAFTGGAVGEGAKTSIGFAGGYNAEAGVWNESHTAFTGIDAIQLGTGNNKTQKTLQVYDHMLMDADGNVPQSALMNILNKDTEGNYTFKAGLMPSSGVNVETANGLAIWRYTE